MQIIYFKHVKYFNILNNIIIIIFKWNKEKTINKQKINNI